MNLYGNSVWQEKQVCICEPETARFTFYRIPKALFQEERFRSLSAEAKMLYGILLDRLSLSLKNGWLDDQGRGYIIFTISEVIAHMGCANKKAISLLAELEKKAGLIERKRQCLGRPNLIYVKHFVPEVDTRCILDTSEVSL